ncbi:MAG: SDR family NAD(P)-dependent oxidoreductase, partial [Clostridia bacterium]|nr:SDR family NAD(P)-dependent oxidoreductase [Clostridia bacterium]
VVIVTSELAPLPPLPFTGIYAITKAALDRYADALRMELQLTGKKVIVLRPGAVKTGMLPVSVKKLEDFCANTKTYKVSSERFKKVVERVESRNVPPEKIASVIKKALEARHPKNVYTINRNPLLLLYGAMPRRLRLWAIRKILS